MGIFNIGGWVNTRGRGLQDEGREPTQPRQRLAHLGANQRKPLRLCSTVEAGVLNALRGQRAPIELGLEGALLELGRSVALATTSARGSAEVSPLPQHLCAVARLKCRLCHSERRGGSLDSSDGAAKKSQ